MIPRLIALAALAGLLAAGCSSNKGGTSDQDQNPASTTGTTEKPNPNTPPDGSGGPVRGPGTGGMGGTSTTPGGSNSGTGGSQGTKPDETAPPIRPDNSGQEHPPPPQHQPQ